MLSGKFAGLGKMPNIENNLRTLAATGSGPALCSEPENNWPNCKQLRTNSS
jgi:hypothetical protein